MNPVRPSPCCFCIGCRSGLLIIGYYTLVTSVCAVVVFVSILLGMFPYQQECFKELPYLRHELLMWLAAVTGVMSAISGVVLIVGIHQNSLLCVKVFYASSCLLFVWNVARLVMHAVLALSYPLAVTVIRRGIDAYILIALRKFYLEVRTSNVREDENEDEYQEIEELEGVRRSIIEVELPMIAPPTRPPHHRSTNEILLTQADFIGIGKSTAVSSYSLDPKGKEPQSPKTRITNYY